MTPEQYRDLLQSGAWGFDGKIPPLPPVEWRPWRRRALQRCIYAAEAFLRGKDRGSIAIFLGEPELSRQRISQLVFRGTEFLVGRNWIHPVDQPKPAKGKKKVLPQKAAKAGKGN